MRKFKEEEQPTRAAIYIRVSSPMQVDEGYSLAYQKAECVKYVEQKGWVAAVVYEEPGISAKDDKRPVFRQMMADAEAGAFDVLVVDKIDRFCRNLRNSLSNLAILNSNGILFATVSQKFDFTTPEGRLSFNIFAAFAEYYIDNLSHETSKGKLQRVREGRHNNSVPYGYTSILDATGKRLAVPDPAAAEFVRQAFERYATGRYTDQDIANWLNEQGARIREGRIFVKDTVRELLKSPFYIGFVAYGGLKRDRRTEPELYKGLHEPILSQEVFERALAVRAEKTAGKKRSHPTDHVYLLQSLVACSHCGVNMRVQSSALGYSYYVDPAKDRGVHCTATPRSIRAEIIDSQIAELVTRIELPEDWQAELQAMLQEDLRQSAAERERREIQSRLKRMRESYNYGLYEGEEGKYLAQVKELQERLRVLKPVAEDDVNNAADIIWTIGKTWSMARAEEQAELVQLIFRKIHCDTSAKVITEIEAHYEFVPLLKMVKSLEHVEENRFRPVPPAVPN
jgi:DNA invertase Pin-like site-specific DNA recombinase